MISGGNIKSGRFLNSPGYSILALYMPLTVIAALVLLVEAFLPLPSAFLLIHACVSALAAFVYCDLITAGKFGHTTSAIGGITAMVVSYIVSSFFYRESGHTEWLLWKKLFLPSLPTILASLETLYIWVSVVSLKRLFNARKRFETYTALHRGEQLQKALEQDPGLTPYNGVEIIKARRLYLFQLMIISVITFITVFLGITLPLPLSLLLIIMVVSGICICGFFGILQREHKHAGEGIVLSAFNRIKHILAMGIISVLAIAASLVLSSDKSILPFSVIAGFFFRVFGQFYHSPFTEEAKTAAPAELDPLFSSLDRMENSATWLIRHLPQYGFIVFVIGGFIFLVVLFRMKRFRILRKELPVHQSMGRTIIEWFKGLLFALGSLFGKGKTPPVPNKPSAGQIRWTSEAILGAYSQAKKQDMQQSVTLFARLIIWGGEVRHVLWKPAHGPGEYCSLLAASALPQTVPPQTALPQTASAAAETASAQQRQNGGIIRCGELFELALYSTEVLSPAERDEFRDLVEEITCGS